MTHRDLIIWQKAMTLVEYVYRVTQGFPDEECYGLTSQVRRASVSVPSNIAEGHARQTTKEYIHFLSISRGSLLEVDTQLEISLRLKFVDDIREEEALIIELHKMLNASITSLRKKL